MNEELLFYTYDQNRITFQTPYQNITIVTGMPPMSEDEDATENNLKLNTNLPIESPNTGNFITSNNFDSYTKFQVIPGSESITQNTETRTYAVTFGNSESDSHSDGRQLEYEQNLSLAADKNYWIFYGNPNLTTNIQMALFKTDVDINLDDIDFVNVENGEYFIYCCIYEEGNNYMRLYPTEYSATPTYYLNANKEWIQNVSNASNVTIYTIVDSKFKLLPTLPEISTDLILVPNTIPITNGNSSSLQTDDKRHQSIMYIFSRTNFSGLPADQTVLYFYYFIDSSHKGYTQRIAYEQGLVLEQNTLYLILHGDYTTTTFQVAYFIPGKENFNIDSINFDLNDGGSYYIYKCPLGYDAYYLTPTVNSTNSPPYYIGLINNQIQTITDESSVVVYKATDIGLKLLPQSA